MRWSIAVGCFLLGAMAMYSAEIVSREARGAMPDERQITANESGHILANIGVWSADGEWLVYDTRPDPEGAVFEGNTIEVVNTRSREVKTLYRSQNGAHCGAPTFSPDGRKLLLWWGRKIPRRTGGTAPGIGKGCW